MPAAAVVSFGDEEVGVGFVVFSVRDMGCSRCASGVREPLVTGRSAILIEYGLLMLR